MMGPTMTLNSFLNNFRTTDKTVMTHCAFGTTEGSLMGKFNCPDDGEILRLIADENLRGNVPALLEVRPKEFPLVIDLDFNCLLTEDTPKRLFDLEKGLRPFIETIDEHYRKFFKDVKTTTYYIQARDEGYESTRAKKDKSGREDTFKDGLHIVCPELRTTGENHCRIRTIGLEEDWLETLRLDDHGFTNAPASVWDLCVIKPGGNNWFPIGCSKDGLKPYKLIALYQRRDPEAKMIRQAPKEELMNAYRKNCSMRHKRTEKPVLTITDDTELSDEFFGTALDISKAGKTKKEKTAKSDKADKPGKPTDLKALARACKKLPDEWFADWDHWHKFILLLKGFNPDCATLNFCVEQCRRAEDYNNDAGEAATRKHWDELESEPAKDTLAVIKYWAKPDTSGEDAAWDALYAKKKADFEKPDENGIPAHLKLNNPAAFYCRLPEVGYVLRKKEDFKTMFEHIPMPRRKDKAPNFVGNWMADDSIPIYDGFGFYPEKEKCPPGILNTFKGLACDAPEVRSAEPLEMPEILQLLRWLCESDAVYDYCLKWFAWRLQNPGRQCGVALIFGGGQGTGKDTFASYFAKFIIGTHSMKTENPGEDILGNFNGKMKDNLFIHIEEASGKDFIAGSNKFKGLITAEMIRLRLMNTDPFDIRFFAAFFLSTNAMNPVSIETDDRRFFFNSVKDHPFKQDRTWFGDWVARSRRPGTIRWFSDYLRNLDLTGFDLIASRPATKAGEICRTLHIPHHYGFLEHWAFFENRLHDWVKEEDKPKVEEAVVQVGATEWFAAYNKWIEKTRSAFGGTSQKKFAMLIKEADPAGVSHRRTKTRAVYEIQINKLRRWLVEKKLVSDSTNADLVNGVQCLIEDNEMEF